MDLPSSWSPTEKRQLARANFFNAILQIKNYEECEDFFNELLRDTELEILNIRVTAGLEFAAGVPPQEVQSDRFEGAMMMLHWAHGSVGFKRIIMRLHREIQALNEKKI